MNSLNTPWGTANITNDGYYKITSLQEGNCGKPLHRLIAKEYFGDWIDNPSDYYIIHHIDENKLNNCVLNLEPMTRESHQRLHRHGKTMSEETKQKIRENRRDYSGKNNPMYRKNRSGENAPFFGKNHSDETKLKMSKKRSTTGYFRVSKRKGYFVYRYLVNKKEKSITSKTIDELERKVKSKDLMWYKF